MASLPTLPWSTRQVTIESVYDELVELGVPDISMEVVGDYDEMLNEGFRLADKYKTNATIKLHVMWMV